MSKNPFDLNHLSTPSFIPTTATPAMFPGFELEKGRGTDVSPTFINEPLVPTSSDSTKLPEDVVWAIDAIVRAEEEDVSGPSRINKINSENTIDMTIKDTNSYARVVLNDELRKLRIVDNNDGTASAVKEYPNDKTNEIANEVWESIVEERIRKEAKRVNEHTEREAEKPEADVAPQGYRKIEILPWFIEDAKERGIAIPSSIQISELLDKRLSRDGKVLAVQQNNLAFACEKADIETAGTILIGSLDFDEDDEPELSMGHLDHRGEIKEDLRQSVDTAELMINPDLRITDREGLLEINKALYTAIILTDRLYNARSISKEKNKLEESLDQSRLDRLKTSLGLLAANGTAFTSGVFEVLPKGIQLVVSAAAATGTLGNTIYTMTHKIPALDTLSDSKIIDLMESGVSEEAEALAKEFPVLDFDLYERF